MNKIININLAGRLIPIEEGAFATLHNYVNWLKQYFGREKGGDEIVRDMEDRIGELFQNRLKGGAACINEADVQSVINIMGSPEQIVSEASGEETLNESGPEPQPGAGNYFTDNGKRLSRSNKEKVIGGVCGGIAMYFHIDPVIVRVIFALVSLTYGIGVVIYGLLWAILPADEQEHITGLRRRLYRNPDRKVVGGVCSGLAEYFHVDPVILRLLFVLPLLGTMFFSIIDDDIFFLPAFIGGIPTLLLLYVILWASVPEAKTVAEKLEMRGEHVDVQSLSHAIRTEDRKTTQEEKTTAPPHSGGHKGPNVFALLMKILVYIILGFCLLILASVLVGLITALFGIAISSMFVFPYKSLITDSETIQWVLWISLLILLTVPFYGIIRLLVRLISGRRNAGNRWIHLSLGVLFVAAILSIVSVAGLLINDFRSSFTDDESVAIQQPANDTMIIRQAVIDQKGVVKLRKWDHDDLWFRMKDDSTVLINNIRLEIVPSPDSLYHLIAHKKAYGRTIERAQAEAGSLSFYLAQEGNVINLPGSVVLPSGRPFRGQGILFELQVPEGSVFRTEGIDDDVYERMHIHVGVNNISYTINEDDAREWKDGVYHIMKRETRHISHPAETNQDTARARISLP